MAYVSVYKKNLTLLAWFDRTSLYRTDCRTPPINNDMDLR